MSHEENNKPFGNKENNSENPSSQSGPQSHTSDPGNFAQRGEHVNKNPNEPMGGLKNDRNTDSDEEKSEKGDSTQDGTQNSSSVTRTSESGAGSGNLTEENRSARTDKFGPEHNSNTTGI